jgi:hypothetical protein
MKLNFREIYKELQEKNKAARVFDMQEVTEKLKEFIKKQRGEKD